MQDPYPAAIEDKDSRPYIEGVGLYVGGVWELHVEKDLSPAEIAGELRAEAHMLGEHLRNGGESPLDSHPVRDITVEEVESALDYCRDNRAQMDEILREKDRFWSAALSTTVDEAYRELQQLDLQHLDVEVEKEEGRLVFSWD